MAIGKKFKRKSNSTIEAVRQVAQSPQTAKNVQGISTQRNAYRTSSVKKQYSDTRSSVGRSGGGQANRAISKTMQNGSNEPKSVSGRAMQLKTSYKNAVKSRSNYKYPDQMASTANNNTRADVYNRVMTGSSLGKKKQDFKKVNTEKSTAHNMKRKTIREVSDFDLQMGDWGRAGARHESTMGADMRWVGREAKWDREKKRKKRK